MDWATFWANFSQNNLVTLTGGKKFHKNRLQMNEYAGVFTVVNMHTKLQMY
jgi:hypothetical protein